jgi:hypothetical protein
MRVIVMHDVMWFKHMSFQPDDVIGMLDLQDA